MGPWGCVSRQLFRDPAASCHSCGPARVPGVLQLAEGETEEGKVSQPLPTRCFPHIPLTQDWPCHLVPGAGKRGQVCPQRRGRSVVWWRGWLLSGPGKLQLSWFLPHWVVRECNRSCVNCSSLGLTVSGSADVSCWCHGTSACASGQCLTVPPGQRELFSPSPPPSLPHRADRCTPLLVFCPLCLNLKAPHTPLAAGSGLPIPHLACRSGRPAHRAAPRAPGPTSASIQEAPSLPIPHACASSAPPPTATARVPRPHSQCSSRRLPRWRPRAPGRSPCLCPVPLCLSCLAH